MKKSYLVVAAGALLLLVGGLLLIPSQDEKPDDKAVKDGAIGPESISSENNASDTSSPVETEEREYSYGTPNPNDERLIRLPDGRTQWVQSLNTSRQLVPSLDQEEHIGLIMSLFQDYKFIFKQHPVGTDNREFTNQLLGDNDYNFVFIAPDSPALVNGELVDTWGSPYFFHAVSSERLEVISAGPDQELWTDDDVNPWPSSYLDEGDELEIEAAE